MSSTPVTPADISVRLALDIQEYKKGLQAKGVEDKQAAAAAVREYTRGRKKELAEAAKAARRAVEIAKKADGQIEKSREELLREERAAASAAALAFKRQEDERVAAALEADKEIKKALDQQNKEFLKSIPIVGEVAETIEGLTAEGQGLEAQSARLGAQHKLLVGSFAAVAAAVVAAGAAFAAMRQHTHEVRTQIAELNQTTLLLPETLAAIQLAAGGEILSDLRTDLVDFNKKISEARRGSGELAEAFASVERQARLQGRAFDTTDEIFRAFVMHIQDLPPGAKQAELALKAFGGEGTRFMAALGDTNLQEFVGLTDRFGARVTPEAIEQTKEWNKATQILSDLIQGTTDALADEALEIAGYGGAVRNLVEDVVVADARFRVFASNMSSYADILGASMKILGAPGVGSIPEFGEDGKPLIPKNPLQDIIADMRAAADAIQDPAAEIDKALADLRERYEQLDKAAEETTETLVSQRDMVEALGFAYEEESNTAVSSEERKKKAKEAAAKRRRQLEEEEREAMAALQANTDRLTADVLAKYHAMYTDLAKARDNLGPLLPFQDLEKVITTDTIGGSEFNNLASEVGAKAAGTFEDQFADSGIDQEMLTKAQAGLAVMGEYSRGISDMIGNAGELMLKRHEGNAVKQRKIMRDLFYAQKAAAISQVIIDSASAVMRTFTIDPTGVMAAIMAPIIAGTAALQIGVIAAESPSFHTGGMIPGRGNRPALGMAPDETPITALSGEGVVSRRGMAALDAINRGDAMGGAAPVVVYGARIFDEVQADLVRLPGSSLSRAIRAKTRRRIGQR